MQSTYGFIDYYLSKNGKDLVKLLNDGELWIKVKDTLTPSITPDVLFARLKEQSRAA
jgi:hypothetical protein